MSAIDAGNEVKKNLKIGVGKRKWENWCGEWFAVEKLYT